MKPLVRLIVFLVAINGAESLFSATYTGTVLSIEGNVAKVAMNGDVFPPAGARAEIFFKMPGIDEEILVATGSALKIDHGDLLVKIEEATGTVEKGHLVRFGPASTDNTLSPPPAISPTQPPAAPASIVGDWAGNEPGGDHVSFTFRMDGTLSYVRVSGKKKNTLHGKYRTNCSTTPCRLELFDFTVNGARARGETIIGLFELHGLEMRFDLSNELQRNPEKGFTKGAIALTRAKSDEPTSSPSPSLFSTPEPKITPPPAATAPIDPAALELGNKAIAQYSAGNVAGAIASYTEAIQLAPNVAVFYLNRANAYLYKPDFRAAIADVNKALELKIEKADDAYVIRGAAQAGLGNFDAAIADCNRALKINPKHALAYNNRANDKLRQRNYSGALADCNQALKLDPNLALAYYNRGYVYYNTGNRAGALADWKRAVQMQPGFGAELNPFIAQLEQTRRTR